MAFEAKNKHAQALQQPVRLEPGKVVLGVAERPQGPIRPVEPSRPQVEEVAREASKPTEPEQGQPGYYPYKTLGEIRRIRRVVAAVGIFYSQQHHAEEVIRAALEVLREGVA